MKVTICILHNIPEKKNTGINLI